MAAHGSRRLHKMNANLNMILGIELACGCQGIGFRAPLKTSPILEDVISRVRLRIKPLAEDRFMAPDLQKAAVVIADGSLIQGIDMPADILGRPTA